MSDALLPSPLEKKQKQKQRQKKQKDKAQEKPPPPTATPLLREFLDVPGAPGAPGDPERKLTIMTYNILAQSLARRELFPHALKRKPRQKLIIDEFNLYKPDIACLQEVDHVEDEYGRAFKEAGYEMESYRHSTKKHGCAILYSRAKFRRLTAATVDYDAAEACPPTQRTGNVGMMIALEFKEIKKGEKVAGVIVATTHLYWRPESYYERFRQAMLLRERMVEFRREVEEMVERREGGGGREWAIFLAGDLNTTPIDPGYPLLTHHPLNPYQRAWLEWSMRPINDQFDLNTGGPNTAFPPPDPPSNPSEDPAPLTPGPPLLPLVNLLTRVERLPQCRSIYAVYGTVDPELAGGYGEPKFTNYSGSFKGTLDYVIIIEKEEREGKEDGVRVEPMRILAMPREEDMQPSLPNARFGSDHVCLLAEVGVWGR